MKLEETVLEGRFVRLAPLADKHQDGLIAAVSGGELWNLPVTLVPNPDEVPQFLRNAREAYSSGTELSFDTIEVALLRSVSLLRVRNYDPDQAAQSVFRYRPGFAFVSGPAKVNARISHLTESKSAARKYAHPAAAAPGHDVPTKEIPGHEIPEGQSLEGYQYRTHLRL